MKRLGMFLFGAATAGFVSYLFSRALDEESASAYETGRQEAIPAALMAAIREGKTVVVSSGQPTTPDDFNSEAEQ